MMAASCVSRAIPLPKSFETMKIPGLVVVTLRNHKTGEIWYDEYPNLLTDIGDLYYANRLGASIAPASLPVPSLANGMKLGSGNTPVTKAGAGAILATYIAASNRQFDGVGVPGGPFPKTNNLGTGAGVQVQYQVSWPAGTVINGSVNEVVLVPTATTDGTDAASQVFSRALIGPYNKDANTELDVLWQHLVLGA
jgi:hypothetical protein